MPDRVRPLSTERLVSWIGDELTARDAILGIPGSLFFHPAASDPFTLRWHDLTLETPIGVAAGPHTQLTGNILSSWLCGARVIELKTVQTLDNITVPKPCIDMQDEGYNVEWSQELALDASFQEYLRAWVLIHALHRHLNFPGDLPGVLFDVSVGYDLHGIRQPNMQHFLERCVDGRAEIASILPTVAAVFPDAAAAELPGRMAGGITLSTMHGCPAEEIGLIAAHLMESWELHTTVKLNPTLLGPEEINFVLHDQLGFEEVTVPDEAFAHDPRFDEMVHLIDHLQATAQKCGVEFAVKLCNTLESINHREVFDLDQSRMYMSGRPLHALAVRLARRLSDAFEGGLRMSFSGGADAFNVPNLLAAGLCPVTTCSDLLRPGGYLRLRQYLSNIRSAMDTVGARDLDELIMRTAGQPESGDQADPSILEAARQNLTLYADGVLFDPSLARPGFDRSRTKTSRHLGTFDCIAAPCTDACAVGQRVPQYMRLVRTGDLDAAAEVIVRDNPLPGILGRACHHPCELPCLRTHLDDPLAIREIKRFVTDHATVTAGIAASQRSEARVAIIGAGPCGLAAAEFLRRAGMMVTVFEGRSAAGGMVSGSIPGYRAAEQVVESDLRRVLDNGVEVRFGISVGRDLTIADLRREGYRYIVAAVGAQQGVGLGIPGEDSAGVWDGLVFLGAARNGQLLEVSGPVGVVGGGDVAVDCARTARRLGAEQVEIIYRRSVAEMPALRDDLEALAREGIAVREVTVPHEVVVDDGRIVALKAKNTMLGAHDAGGRRRPIVMWGSDHEIPLGTLVVAVGQRADLSVFTGEPVVTNGDGFVEVDAETMETSVTDLFAGGDLVGDGPSTIVEACADGRRIAQTIAAREGVGEVVPSEPRRTVDLTDMLRRRSHRERRYPVPVNPASPVASFDEVIRTYGDEQARLEASRCLDCDLLCSTCDSVCPNRAIVTYTAPETHLMLPLLKWRAGSAEVVDRERFDVNQPYQVAVLADLCNDCGNCTTFCPTAGRPHADKPRLFLDAGDFALQRDNAFRISRHEGSWEIEGVFSGMRHRLEVGDTLRYRSPTVELVLDPSTFDVIEAHPRDGSPPADPVGLQRCAVLYVLFRGLRDSVPWLPVSSSRADR
jgi:putative selenate reductase